MKSALFEEGKIVVHTDGGSRGNPGPAAAGIIVGNKEYGEYLGRMTNNEAEYWAVVFALKKIKQLVGSKKSKELEVEVYMDSELVQRQLSGRYKIEEPDLQGLFLQVWNLRLDFKKVDFIHVMRGQNQRADAMANKVLDSHARE